jgi:hypothetical protein
MSGGGGRLSYASHLSSAFAAVAQLLRRRIDECVTPTFIQGKIYAGGDGDR